MKKVVDPFALLGMIGASISNDMLPITETYMTHIEATKPQIKYHWLVASAIPLGYITKSLMIPFLYFNAASYYLYKRDLDLRSVYVNNSTEMHRKRQVVLESVLKDKDLNGDLSQLDELLKAKINEVEK